MISKLHNNKKKTSEMSRKLEILKTTAIECKLSYKSDYYDRTLQL